MAKIAKMTLMAIIKGPLAPNGYLFWCQLIVLIFRPMCEYASVQKEPLLVQYFICLSPKDGQNSPKWPYWPPLMVH